MGPALRISGVVMALAALQGCASETVEVAYRPAVGEVAVYRTSVRAVTVSRIGEEGPRRRVATSVLTARHRVLSSEADGARVEVRLEQEEGAPSTFIVRFDRAGQLSEVQQIEGLPADALGDLGLAQILPAAAGSPPQRGLAPGDTWDIDEPVALVDGAPAVRLTGRGRLVSLGVADGRHLATVESRYRLPVRRTAADTEGRLAMDGSVATRAQVSYDLDSDQVHGVESTSAGHYEVTLLPPAGVTGVPVPGTLDVEVIATTRRAG